MTRRRSLAVVAVAAVGTVALAVGIAQGSSGAGGDTQVATIDAAVEAADVRLCPGAAPVGQLDPGATIALTGRSEDGAWLQLRSPLDEDEQVWIDSTLVVVTTPDELPIVRCGAVDLAIELIGGAELTLTPKTTTTTTTSTTPGATTTTGATGGSTTTTGPADAEDPDDPAAPTTTARTGPVGPAPTTPTTTRPRTTTTQRPTTTSTTTTLPPDTSPPNIEAFEASVASLFESGRAGCSTPNQATLSARVTDRSGLYAVRLVWRVTNATRTATYANGNVPMHLVSGDLWRGTLGPFGQVLPSGVQGVLEWRVQAYDNTAARNNQVLSAPTNVWPAVVNC